jgi:hypothetical protein
MRPRLVAALEGISENWTAFFQEPDNRVSSNGRELTGRRDNATGDFGDEEVDPPMIAMNFCPDGLDCLGVADYLFFAAGAGGGAIGLISVSIKSGFPVTRSRCG